MKRSTAIHIGFFIGLGVLLALAAGFYFLYKRKRSQNHAAAVCTLNIAPLDTQKRSSFGSLGNRLSQDAYASAREDDIQRAGANKADSAKRNPQFEQKDATRTNEEVSGASSSTKTTPTPPGISVLVAKSPAVD